MAGPIALFLGNGCDEKMTTSLPVTIILVVLMFGFIIFIHELGHFLTAKAAGVKVHEFAIGMGPVLFKFYKGDTKYNLRLLPIGGFVAMEGEDEESSDRDAFCNKPVWKRIIVIVAGAAMNILFGFILMFLLVSMQGRLSTTQVALFDEGAVSSEKLQVGDVILEVNGANVHIANDLVFELVGAGTDPVNMLVQRDGEELLLENIPFHSEVLEDGTAVFSMDFKVKGVPKTLGGMFRESFYMTTGVVKQAWVSFIKLVTGQFQVNQLSGPVGVSGAIGQAAAVGFSSLMLMVAFVTINIGVFNLLPLPALDGGRLVFLIIEGLRGKPVPAKYEGLIHAAGLVLLMGLMIFVTYQDIVRLISK